MSALEETRGHWPDGGYEFMEAWRRRGWRPIPGWGRDGWDLGSWPYAVVLHRDTTKRTATGTSSKHELAYYVEGDVELKRFATREDRDAATDELAAFHWRHEGVEWVRDDPAGPLPDHLRGPYHRDRA